MYMSCQALDGKIQKDTPFTGRDDNSQDEIGHISQKVSKAVISGRHGASASPGNEPLTCGISSEDINLPSRFSKL